MTAEFSHFNDVPIVPSPELYVASEARVSDLDAEIVPVNLTQHYLQDIGRTALLTAEQEVSLAQEIEAGLLAQELLDDADRLTSQLPQLRPDANKATLIGELQQIAHIGQQSHDRLVLANLRYSVSVAKRYTGRGMPFLDIIQQGNLGIIRAVEKFDYTKGYKFSTYAKSWVEQFIKEGFMEANHVVRLPRTPYEELTKFQAVNYKFLQLNGRYGSDAELATMLDTTPQNIAKVRDLTKLQPVTINQPIGEDDGSTLGDMIVDDLSIDPAEQIIALDGAERLERALDSLEPLAREIMRLHYGFETGQVVRIAEIARQKGITAAILRYVHHKSLGILRQQFTEQDQAQQELPK